jgi:hypothetical protein
MATTSETASSVLKDVTMVSEKGSQDSSSQHTNPSLLKAAHKHLWALLWCLYGLWCIFANNYSKIAGSSVLGIPQFRKDFGKAFDGNYVLSATWQSAFNGAPQAA